MKHQPDEVHVKHQPDEVDQFIRSQRRRRLGRTLLLGLLAAGGYAAYTQMPASIGQLLALQEEIPADEPRAVLARPAPVAPAQDGGGSAKEDPREAGLDRYRHLFSRTFPNYLEELRKHRKFAMSPGGDDGKALEAARTELLKPLEQDEQLRAVVQLITRHAEQRMERSGEEISQLLTNLNGLLQSRSLPFSASGGILPPEAAPDHIPTLRLRFHERLGEEVLRVGEETVTVALLDRLDLTQLEKDPEPRVPAGLEPVVYLRAVSTTLNATLFGALNPDGRWQTVRLLPVPPPIQAVETRLAKTVDGEWRRWLEPRVPAESLDALTRVSSHVTRRNALHREVNLRDPGKQIMIDPPSIRLGWAGKAWLARIEPYAVQGRVRLMLEDIKRLRDWDQEVAGAMRQAGPAVQAVLRESYRTAALAEARRVTMERAGKPVPSALQAKATDAATELPLWNRALAMHLTRLIEPSSSCQTEVAQAVSDALEGPLGGSARVMLEQLAPETLAGRPFGAETAPEVVDALEKVPCEQLAERAQGAWQRLYGPYVPVERGTDAVADAGQEHRR